NVKRFYKGIQRNLVFQCILCFVSEFKCNYALLFLAFFYSSVYRSFYLPQPHIFKTVFFFSCRQGTKVFSQKRLNLRGVYITYKCKVHTVSITKNLFVDSKRTICIQFVIVSFVWNAAGPGIVVVNNFCECITEKCPRVLHDKLYLAFLPVNIRLKQA